MDHLRVHPKFLHSNAASHKWALGAFAELLDNAMDEICNEATYVDIDLLRNNKDGSKMLLVQDNGGGMTSDKMRRCMSLGYSSKSRMANTIGQYGNGFKTSTMRLGADVIVFSCSRNSGRLTRSIGLLSYTFLRSTKQEDIVVPMATGEDFSVESAESRRLLRALVDVGLIRTTTRNRVFGAHKGALDSGLDIPHSEKRFAGFSMQNKNLDASPKVRVYTSKRVFEELEGAKEEYIRYPKSLWSCECEIELKCVVV